MRDHSLRVRQMIFTSLIQSVHDATTERPAAGDEPLVELLRSRALLTVEGIARVRLACATSKVAFSTAATRLGLVTERDMAGAFAEALNIGVAERSAFPGRPLVLPGLNPRFAVSRHVLPIDHNERVVLLAMADPLDDAATAGVAFATGLRVERLAALESDIIDYYHLHEDEKGRQDDTPFMDAAAVAADHAGDLDRLSDRASDAPVIRLVQRLLTAAMDRGASDIHLEPTAESLAIRYRIDGLLEKVEAVSAHWSDAVASRVKLMAGLDIAEKRLPQDGRIQFTGRGRSVDVRVATFPTLHGEAIVLRLLGQQTISLRLDALGLDTGNLEAMRNALGKPHGIVLITGPTGSGKTTTLYAALNELHLPSRKLVTVEDPIEYTLAGVSQLQVKPEIGLTYATALRSVLRNDPDVIMIGEIRDRETADIAVRAALTGHLVLATLHTNTAASAITRLIDLGVEDFLLSSTLVFSAAQRLVRRLCAACKQSEQTTVEQASILGNALKAEAIPRLLPVARGCEVCFGRGFRGRLPIFEGLTIGHAERALLRGFRSEDALLESVAGSGARSLWRDGIDKVLAGETSLDELLSVVEDRRS